MAKATFQMICFCLMLPIPVCLAQESYPCEVFPQITFAGNTYCPFGADVTLVNGTNDCNPQCGINAGICLNGICNCLNLFAGPTCGQLDSCGLTGMPCDAVNGVCVRHSDGMSPACVCQPGWILSVDKTVCNDIDECTIEGFPPVCDEAHGICTNTQGSFSCGCIDGYTLDTDNSTCIRDTAVPPTAATTQGNAATSMMEITTNMAATVQPKPITTKMMDKMTDKKMEPTPEGTPAPISGPPVAAIIIPILIIIIIVVIVVVYIVYKKRQAADKTTAGLRYAEVERKGEAA